jgi:hypothetical protein
MGGLLRIGARVVRRPGTGGSPDWRTVLYGISIQRASDEAGPGVPRMGQASRSRGAGRHRTVLGDRALDGTDTSLSGRQNSAERLEAAPVLPRRNYMGIGGTITLLASRLPHRRRASRHCTRLAAAEELLCRRPALPCAEDGSDHFTTKRQLYTALANSRTLTLECLARR